MVAIQNSGTSQVSAPPGDLYSEEPTMETDLHLRQMLLLISCLDWLWQDRDDFFASGNLTIYFSPKQIKSQDFRGPDFFVVLGTERRSRKSWVVWEEDGKYPNVIVEILSDSTAKADRETKKLIYQNTFRTPEYFWFDPDTLEFAGFLLVGGVYEAMELNEMDRFWSRQLGLYLGIENRKLRFFSPEGDLVPTPEEAAIQAQQQVQQAQQQVQQAQQQADRLAEKLRELGVDPNTL
ncbi:MAG: Uma2 family endonuclease [Cyanobacteria bacterium J06635_1]